MTFTDQDLRDALQPLAGDPVRDAGRVLSALPRPKPPLPPATWWLGGAGVLLGMLLGLAGGFAWGDEPAAPEERAQPNEVESEPQPADNPPPKPPVMEGEIYLMAFGELAVVEPGIGRTVLTPQQWMLVMGATIETTSESRAGVHVPAEDVRVRLDHETVATVEAPRRLQLERGRAYLQTGEHGGEIAVTTPMGEILLREGAGQVTAWPGTLEVLVTEGTATVRTEAGESRRLETGQELSADREGAAVRDVEFPATATSWMTEMIRLQQDPSELRARIAAMVEAYEAGRFRDAAEAEIRKLGADCVRPLVYSLQTVGAEDPAYRVRTAGLASDITDHQRGWWILSLLEHDDPEVRVLAFRALSRVTGENAGGSDEFWERATPGDRARGIELWREVLRGG